MITFHNVWRWIFVLIFNRVLVVSLTFASIVYSFWHFVWCLLFLSLINNLRRENSLLVGDHLAGRFLVGERCVNGRVFLVNIFWVLSSFKIEIIVFNGLSGGETLVWVHMKKFFHKVNLTIVHNCGITSIDGFWMLDIWELESLISCISLEFFSKKVWKVT